MLGILRLMIALSLMTAAVYGVIWLWTGTLPGYEREILGTLGIVTLLSLAIALLSKPIGGGQKG